MPQYGQYNLANSRLVPKLPGVPLPEIQKVLEVKQTLYRQGEGIYDATNDLMDSGVALPASQAALKELNAGAQAQLSQYAQRGDFENLTRELGNTYKAYNRDLQPFVQEYRDYKKWEEDLMKNADLMPETKQKYRQLAMMTHQGIRRDPATGAYVPNFTGPGIVKDIDVSKKVEGWLADVVAKETGQTTRVKSKDGMTWIEAGEKRVRVTQAMLDKAMEYGAALDPEFKAYLNRELTFAGYLNTYNSPEERNAAMNAVGEQLYDRMTKFGQKYLKDNWDISRKEYDSAEATAAANAKYQPGMIVSDMSLRSLDLPSKDPKALGEHVEALTKSQTGLQGQLSSLTQRINQAMASGDQATAAALQTEYHSIKGQYDQVSRQRENAMAVGKNIRENGILGSADFKVKEKEWSALNEKLRAKGWTSETLKETGETFTPAEIVMGNPKVVNGKVEFTTLDGRRLRSNIPASVYEKTMPKTPAITKAGMAPSDLFLKLPAVGLDALLKPITQDNVWVPTFNGGVMPLPITNGEDANSLAGAIGRARRSAYSDQKNFQYSTKQLVFTDELADAFDNLLMANPSLKAYNVNGKDVKDLGEITKYGGRVTGVTFDGVNGGEPAFSIRVDKGKKDGQNNFEHYTIQFPGSTAKELLLNQAYFGKKVPMELANWAQYQVATEQMGIEGNDIARMQLGETKIVPGSNPAYPVYLRVLGVEDPRVPVRAKNGHSKYVAAGTMVNGEFKLLELGKGQDGTPIYPIFDQQNSHSIIQTLPAINAAANPTLKAPKK